MTVLPFPADRLALAPKMDCESCENRPAVSTVTFCPRPGDVAEFRLCKPCGDVALSHSVPVVHRVWTV